MIDNADSTGNRRGAGRAAIEWPTVLLLAATFAAWLALTAAYGRLPGWLVLPPLAVLLTFHSSLQHEIVHGHPTRWHAVNRALGMVPLSFWLPFVRYRQTHLVHHVNDRLTDPLDDPESRYYAPEEWARMGPLSRFAARAQQTLAGWIILGSFWRVGRFLGAELAGCLRGDRGLRAIWAEHLAWCVPVAVWLVWNGWPLWLYLLAVVVPSNGLLLVRSYCEHRANPAVGQRTAIVEDSWLFGPLFLFNNLHALHHEDPGLPWYRYLPRYRERRAALVAANGGLVYRSYLEVAARYLFRAHDALQHPHGRAPSA
jgi:fatty acid desaturase